MQIAAFSRETEGLTSTCGAFISTKKARGRFVLYVIHRWIEFRISSRVRAKRQEKEKEKENFAKVHK